MIVVLRYINYQLINLRSKYKYCIFAVNNKKKRINMLSFLGGLFLGAMGMLLVYRNNKAQMSELADKLNKEITELKEKL